VLADNPWSLDAYKMRFDSGAWFPYNSAEPRPVKSKSYLLMCETRDASKPLPVIRWYRNGRAVRNNRHFYIIVSLSHAGPPTAESVKHRSGVCLSLCLSLRVSVRLTIGMLLSTEVF